MSIFRTAVLACASAGAPALAWAQEAAPFVTQVRVPARGSAIDVIAWRSADGIEIARSDLQRLGIAVPPGASERIALSAIPGLEVQEDAANAAILLTCAAACLEPQRLSNETPPTLQVERARGAYLNYDVDLQWIEDERVSGSSLAHAGVFGRWGLIDSSWSAVSDGEAAGVTRLETRWTFDDVARRLRVRIGDSAALAASGAPVRFAGVQIGREFGLTPREITHPTAILSGEAESASVVELYVDGALRAREAVSAGPFVFDNAPLVNGGGEAQMVVTDVSGRQQVITRAFFVSANLLRPGLSDWSLAAGAERRRFGRDSADYGRALVTGRYRRGVTRWLTAETALDATSDVVTGQAGVLLAHAAFGQVRAAHARNGDGGASEVSWVQARESWSVGVQADTRDAAFHPLGREAGALRQSFAGNVSVEFGAFGVAALTAASVDFFEEEDARTFSLAYTPRLADGSLTARVIYTEREERELAFGLVFTASLNSEVSGGLGFEAGSRGPSYRASIQRAPEADGGVGWRARASAGRREHAEIAARRRGRLGESIVQIASANGVAGARFGHGGSVGVIEGETFAAGPIRGAFALVDVGAPGVRVTRDRFAAAVTDADGRAMLSDLRPYDANLIGIRAEDLPFDRTPAATQIQTRPGEGGGVVLRFTEAAAPLIETRALIGLQPAPRGAVLVRRRDGARFPVGRDGRVVLRGAENGDVVELDLDRRCAARSDARSASDGLALQCGDA